MKLTLENEQFAVFDDVLPPRALEQLWNHFQATKFTAVPVGLPGSPWLPTDGPAMMGPGLVAWADPANKTIDPEHARFPTSTPIDPLIQRLLDEQPRLAPWVGPAIQEWAVLSAVPWLYPPGSGLSWHTDSSMYSGAFTYYLHPTWDPQWGGELVFAHPSARAERELVPGDHSQRFDRSPLAASIAEMGIGHYVVPRRNRLVVIAGGHPHKIARVDVTAGHHVRASIAGFYVRARSLATLVKPGR